MERYKAEELQKVIDEYSMTRDEGMRRIMLIPLSQSIEPLLPKFNTGTYKIDLMAFMGPLLSIVPDKESEKEHIYLPVVDGHNKIDIMRFGRERFEKEYCIKVPWSVMKEAFRHRSNKVMGEIALNNSSKIFEQ